MSGKHAIRRRKRDLIQEFFEANIGQRFPTFAMHLRFGTAFRSRVSDINRDLKCRIRIRNEAKVAGMEEHSIYFAEWRTVTTDAREPEKARQKPLGRDCGASSSTHMDALDGFAARSPRRKSEARQPSLFEERRA